MTKTYVCQTHDVRMTRDGRNVKVNYVKHQPSLPPSCALLQMAEIKELERGAEYDNGVTGRKAISMCDVVRE